MTMMITGVASTSGRIASLSLFAACSVWTKRLKEPLAPGGICLVAIWGGYVSVIGDAASERARLVRLVQQQRYATAAASWPWRGQHI